MHGQQNIETSFWNSVTRCPWKSCGKGAWASGEEWQSCGWVRGLDLLKLASRCLRTLFGTSREQQQLDQELRDCLLAITRFWGGRGNLFARYTSVCDLFNASSGACALPPVALDIDDDDPDSDDDDPDDSPTYSSSRIAIALNWQFLLFHFFC